MCSQPQVPHCAGTSRLTTAVGAMRFGAEHVALKPFLQRMLDEADAEDAADTVIGRTSERGPSCTPPI